MRYFINFDANTGVSINNFLQPNGYASSDVIGLVYDILHNNNGCCPLDGSKAALENGALWQGSDATQDVIEQLHSAICRWEDKQA
jgi:hypothetical protein